MTEVREREKKEWWDMETTEMEENWRTKGTKTNQFLELQKAHLVDFSFLISLGSIPEFNHFKCHSSIYLIFSFLSA